ncbi:hypothetical protein ACT9T1_10210 [Staphylococcus xylosus]|uniref:hypothetical protein n=1 Tax=Staphylococcus xylosus TaxID=1288 RepID=UPI000E69908B|nr:hypothetical protein [Staphylococcus xylosus]RIM85375.1 hypothetical protein BU107_12160 [Staphylococcus xylosus]
MAKLKGQAIKIFDNEIYAKSLKSKELNKDYNNLTSQLRDLDNKIEYYRKDGDYAEVTKLKRKQSELENEIVKLDDKLNSDDFVVTDNEFERFYDAYHKELSELKGNHKALKKEMNNQIESLMKIYRKLIENKNNAGRVISRERYVASEKTNPGSVNNIYIWQMLHHQINLGDGDKYNEQTTPRGYAWKVEKALETISTDEFRKYHFGKKQW